MGQLRALLQAARGRPARNAPVVTRKEVPPQYVRPPVTPRQAAGSEEPLRIVILAQAPVSRQAAESILLALEGVETDEPPTADPAVTIYAAHSPQEVIALLGPGLEPQAHSLLLDLEGAIEPEHAALLGFLADVRYDCPAAQLRQALADVRRGYPSGQAELGGRFHLARENGRLTLEEKRILNMAARSLSREQISQELAIEAGTLRRRITALRRTLGLSRNEPLAAAAVRMGFPVREPPREEAAGTS